MEDASRLFGGLGLGEAAEGGNPSFTLSQLAWLGAQLACTRHAQGSIPRSMPNDGLMALLKEEGD